MQLSKFSRFAVLSTAAAIVLLTILVAPIQGASEAAGQTEVLPGTLPMPELVKNKFYVRYVFVAAERALRPNGQVNKKYFRKDFAADVTHYVSQPVVRGCARGRVFISHPYPASRTDFVSAVDEVDTAFTAVVTGWRQGFYFGMPGTLLRIAPEEALKGTPHGGSRYVFVAGGEFYVNDTRLCVEAEQWSSIPALGSRVLILFEQEHYEDLEILPIGPTGIVPLEGRMEGDLPELYRRTNPEMLEMSVDELLGRVRSIAEDKRAGRKDR